MLRFLRVLGLSAFLGAILLAGAVRAAAAARALPPPPPPLPPPPVLPVPVPVVQFFLLDRLLCRRQCWLGLQSGTFTTALGPDPFAVTSNGFVGGAELGYNWQAGPFVLGAEPDFQGASASGSLSANAGPAISATAKTPWFGTLRGRVGYAFDNILLYATGGGVYGDSSWSGSVSTVGNFSSATTFGTWTAPASRWPSGAAGARSSNICSSARRRRPRRCRPSLRSAEAPATTSFASAPTIISDAVFP
jgi:hypothetical protein